LPILTSALRAFRKEFPELEIALEQRSSEAQMQGLRDGSLDLAVFSAVQGIDGILVQTVRRYRFVALVPTDWPIASKKRLRLTDLAELPFIVAPHDRAPIVQSAIMLACHGAGFSPKIAQAAIQAYTIEGLVSAGVGIALQPEIYRGIPLEGVSYKAIFDLPDYMHWDLMVGVIDCAKPNQVIKNLADKITFAGGQALPQMDVTNNKE
jgi:DNA-binding transcriptional LysR family regulator